MTKSNRALFLDRDGIINKIIKYEYGFDSPQTELDVNLVDGIAKIISWANNENIPVILISNQPGIGRGKMTKEKFDLINKTIDDELESLGAKLDYKFYCFHHINSLVEEFRLDCNCRKPKPGLLFLAEDKLNLNLNQSIFLGDRGTDAMAGTAANCQTIIYLHNDQLPCFLNEAQTTPSTYKVSHLSEAYSILKTFFGK